MKKITSTDQLPEWFFERNYSKNLSDIEWYREIRIRQRFEKTLEVYEDIKADPPHPKSLFWFFKVEMPLWIQQLDLLNSINLIEDLGNLPESEANHIELGRAMLLVLVSYRAIETDGPLLQISQDGTPVNDLSVSEAIYLSHALDNETVKKGSKRYRSLLNAWFKTIQEINNAKEPPVIFPYSYEKKLTDYRRKITDEEMGILNSPVEEYAGLGNPFLSFGRPLNGTPITIDTQFDDATIINSFKEWLKHTREQEGTKAKKPFRQNDFDDWKLYKIREIWDLQNWATIKGVKILDHVLADAVWPTPPDSLSPIDQLRTTSKKHVNKVFQFETVVRLYSQLQLQHGEKFLEQ